MSRFYVRPSDIKGGNIYVSGEEAHHIIDVMRLGKGHNIVAFDGEGKEYEGIIREAGRNRVVAEITKTRDVKTGERCRITLAQALPKKSGIDFIIEKATELGVNAIIPLHTSRTVVKLKSEKKDSACERWKKIAIAASKQCGRLKMPLISPVEEFCEAVKKAKDFDLAVMACLHKDTENIKNALAGFKGESVMAFIGPEGDFTEEEIEAARANGVRLVSLGPRVLRVDTAAVSILSILRYELE